MPDNQKFPKNSHTFLYRGWTHFALAWCLQGIEWWTNIPSFAFIVERLTKKLTFAKLGLPNFRVYIWSCRVLWRSCSLYSPLIGCCVAIVIAFTNYHAVRQRGHSAFVKHWTRNFRVYILQSPVEIMMFVLSFDWLLCSYCDCFHQLSRSTSERI